MKRQIAFVAVLGVALAVTSMSSAGAARPVGPCRKHCPPPTTTTQASTTTSSSTSSSTSTSTSTSTTPPTSTTSAPSTTQPPAGAFFEDFGSATALVDRFDHGWSGEWNAGALFNDAANDWQADHDMACMDPNTTSRTIHLSSQEQANDAAFFPCTFAGDPAKSHLMTSVNTEGYVTVWFSPKQTFTNVTSVCWDQNVTNEGGGKWTAVNFLTLAEYQGQTDLGYTTRDFPPGPNLPSSPQGDAAYGVSMYPHGSMHLYNAHQFSGGSVSIPETTDKAGRYRHCVVDNGNGTVTMSINQAATSTGLSDYVSLTVPGEIPNGAIRVEFVDDSYNPDKHFFNPEQFVPRDSTGLYTWHWDNVSIS